MLAAIFTVLSDFISQLLLFVYVKEHTVKSLDKIFVYVKERTVKSLDKRQDNMNCKVLVVTRYPIYLLIFVLLVLKSH